MHTEICDRLGIEFPIFAFSHCRDVVAAVSRAGGFGVLGALAFSPDQLEVELSWIDAHSDGRPYGVDIVIPRDDPGRASENPQQLAARLRERVPEGHREFARRLLDEHGVPRLPEGEEASELVGWTQTIARPQIATVLQHPQVKLVANALGTPPVDLIRQIQDSGRLVAALAGSVRHALSHQAAGVDMVIAQGHESAAHTGEITSLVLWPQIIDAIAPTPVLAAGGIGTGRHILAALAIPACHQRRHGSHALVHGQAEPHAAQRLDGSMGCARLARPVADALPGHGDRGVDRADQPLSLAVAGRGGQLGGTDRRVDE
jgi:NAD(P)H-dependent flavin oxidoreductase YrpB (nitropropane dioxygenase family)